jgi:hypothetical protein
MLLSMELPAQALAELRTFFTSAFMSRTYSMPTMACTYLPAVQRQDVKSPNKKKKRERDMNSV